MKFNLIASFQRFIRKSWLSGVIIAAVLFVLIALLSFTGIYEDFENKLYDIRFRIKKPIPEWDYLTFIDIEEQSVASLGDYPWPRGIYGNGLDVLKEVGVRQVTFDFECPYRTPARLNENALINLYNKKNEGKNVNLDDILSVAVNNDEIFAQGVQNFRNAIIPYHIPKDKTERHDITEENREEWEKAKKIFIEKASIKLTEDELKKLEKFIDPEMLNVGLEDIMMPIPELVFAAKDFGYTNNDTDPDGVERKRRIVRIFGGRLFFNMGLAMVMDVCNVKKEDVEIIPGKKIILKDAINPINYVKQDIEIPIDEEGMMYINWAGPGEYRDSFHHLEYFGLIDYPQISELLHDALDEQDMKKGNWKLSNLFKEYNENYKILKSTNDISRKKDTWANIVKLRKEINKIQDDYLHAFVDEMEKDAKKSNDPTFVADIEKVKKAIKIAKHVENLQDKLAIIGYVVQGTQDIGATPSSNQYMMVGAYHNIVNTILNNGFILSLNMYYNLIIMLILSLFMGFFIQRLNAKKSIIVIIAAIIIVNAVNILLFSFLNIWFEQIGTNLAVILPSIVIAGTKFMQEESQKRYIKNAFSRYLAPGVIDRIIESPEALELGGEEREITIFFSDVAKFSTISEKLTPPQLVALLNEYLSAMTDIILGHGGTVDKYEGDAVMAFFGAPHPFEDHALRCCNAAIAQKKKLREMQDEWRRLGTDVLQVRMGMNTGKAVVGNMGSRMRMDYTAMGDSVNLASRLEGVNKYYSTYAMISDTTHEIVKDHVEARKLDIVRVVGKEEPITIFELLGHKGELPAKMYEMLEKYYNALDAFTERDWDKAITHFRQALKIIPDDGPSTIYIDRCREYKKKPPSKSWDGVYRLTGK